MIISAQDQFQVWLPRNVAELFGAFLFSGAFFMLMYTFYFILLILFWKKNVFWILNIWKVGERNTGSTLFIRMNLVFFFHARSSSHKNGI